MWVSLSFKLFAMVLKVNYLKTRSDVCRLNWGKKSHLVADIFISDLYLLFLGGHAAPQLFRRDSKQAKMSFPFCKLPDFGFPQLHDYY